jgi:hypothetical protein
MKKILVLLIICSLFAITTLVFASEPGNNNGIAWTTVTGNNYVNDTSINRGSYYTDQDGKDQTVQVKLTAKAYIPCYLKMEFTGNTGKTVIESFGPEAQGSVTPSNYLMIFDNEMGGFINGAWKGLGTGRNAEVAPGSDVYIAACDTFKVKIYANDDFQYDVIGAPLTNNGKKLDLEMGTSDSLAGTYTNTTFDDSKTINIAIGAPCQTIEKYHKFRVPYTTDTAHGEYSGDVTFKAYTI